MCLLLLRIPRPVPCPPADKRGLKCRWKCGQRSALLKTLVPALRVPLRLVDVDGEEASSVEVPPDLHRQLLAGWLLPEGCVAGSLGVGAAGAAAAVACCMCTWRAPRLPPS
jgi:hypothetical protein